MYFVCYCLTFCKFGGKLGSVILVELECVLSLVLGGPVS